MFEPQAIFVSFPLWRSFLWVPPKGAASRGRLSWVTFFGEAKKVTGCRAAPGLVLRSDDCQKPVRTKSGYRSVGGQRADRNPDSTACGRGEKAYSSKAFRMPAKNVLTAATAFSRGVFSIS
jgi:hypothetical protein